MTFSPFLILFLLTTPLLPNKEKRSFPTENWKIVSRGSISSSDPIGYSITTPGNYLLSENITPATGACSTAIIQICVDDVVLDLGGHSINGTFCMGKGIQILDNHNVVIKNGNLTAVKNTNLTIEPMASNIRISSLTITNPSTNAIEIAGNSIHLKDISIVGNGTPGTPISIDSQLSDMIIENIKISQTNAPGITIGSECSNIQFKKIDIDSCLNSTGIILGSNSCGISFDKIKIISTQNDGLFIDSNCCGITIKNSSFINCVGNGLTIGTGAYGITINHVKITGCQNGIVATGMNDSTFEDCSFSHTSGTYSSYNCALINCQNSNIKKTNFSQATSNNGIAVGLFLDHCTNTLCETITTGGHVGISAYGIYLNSCTGSTMTDIFSQSNQGAESGSGFYQNNCIGTTYSSCKALQNNATNANQTSLATGFCSVNSSSTHFEHCEANSQIAGNSSSYPGYGAFGFYLSNEAQSSLFKCKAIGNGSFTNHPATTAGFYLDGTINAACRCVEVRECIASGNCTSSTTGITAYGFWDTAPRTSNTFIDCYAASNSDNATPRVLTNYCANLPIGGLTQENFPKVEASLDGLLDVANKPPFYNVSILS